jgi:hypothetical protein
MKSKLYKYRNVAFTFNSTYRKWTFTNDAGKGRSTLIQECPGGAETARKVAVQVSASLSRSKVLVDPLVKAGIRKITQSVRDE